MSCRIFVGHEAGCDGGEEEQALLFDSVLMRPFGSFFDSVEEAESFLAYCAARGDDPRSYSPPDFDAVRREWESDQG